MKYCSISASVHIFSHDTAKWVLSGGKEKYEYSPVEIGDFCFIGAVAIITRGVKIGSHCLIGAGAVITKSFPECSIVAGVPTKIIGQVKIDSGKLTFKFF